MKTTRFVIAMMVLMAGISALAYAAQTARQVVIAKMNGPVEVNIANAGWAGAKAGMILKQGDMIRTQPEASAVLNVDADNQTASVEMKQKTQLQIAQLLGAKESSSQKTLLDLAMGEIMIKTKKLNTEKSSFEVKTPTSIVGVRGTTFSVSVEAVE